MQITEEQSLIDLLSQALFNKMKGRVILKDNEFYKWCVENGVDTTILDDEKREVLYAKWRDYKGTTFVKKIGGTTYEVSTHFNPNGRESYLQQWMQLIMNNTDVSQYRK